MFSEQCELDTQYSGDIAVDIALATNAMEGEWLVEYVELTDNVGNRSYYDYQSFDSPLFQVRDEFEYDFEVSLSHPNLASKLTEMPEGKSARVLIDSASQGILKKAAFDAIRGCDKTIVCYKGAYQWIFNGKDIVEDSKDVDLNLAIDSAPGDEFGVDKSIVRLQFAQNGKLPGKAQLRFKSDYLYSFNKVIGTLKLFYDTGAAYELEDTHFDLVFDGSDKWCYVDIVHNSTFIVSTERIKKDISAASIPSIPSLSYTATALTPKVVVKLGGKTLTEGVDYTLHYKNNVNAGNATVIAAGKGSYTGTKDAGFVIEKATVAIPKAVAGLVFNGKKMTGVKNGAGYSIKGGSAKNAGSYKATLTADKNHVFKGGKTSIAVKWKISKATQKITAKSCKVAVKAKKSGKSKVLAKNVIVNLKKKTKATAQTKITYEKANKTGGKRVVVNKKTGKVTLKKGLKAGTYKVKVKLKAAEGKNYKTAKARTIMLTVKVK